MNNIDKTEIIDNNNSSNKLNNKKSFKENLKENLQDNDNRKKKNNNEKEKKPLSFIFSLISYILIGMLIFGILNFRILNSKFYESREFSNIINDYFRHGINNIVYNGLKDENLLDKEVEYNNKIKEIDKVYEEKEKNLYKEFEEKVNKIIEGKEDEEVDLLERILTWTSLSYDSWKELDKTEKLIYINNFKNKYDLYEEKENLQREKENSEKQAEYDVFGINLKGNLDSYRDGLDYFNRFKNLKYCIVDNKDNKLLTNMEGVTNKEDIEKDFKKKSEVYVIIDGRTLNVESNLNRDVLRRLGIYEDRNVDAYVQVPKNIQPGDMIYDIKAKYEDGNEKLLVKISLILGSIGTLIYLLYLTINKKRYFVEGYLNKFYRILYTEIKAIITIASLLAIYCLAWEIGIIYIPYQWEDIIMCIGFSVILFIALSFNIKYIRNCDNVFTDLIKRSVIVKPSIKVYKYLKNKKQYVKDSISLLYFEGKKSYRIWIILGVSLTILLGGIMVTIISFGDPYSAGVAVLIYTIVVTITIILIIINHLASLQNIAKATEEISKGNLDVNLSEEGDIVTSRLAKNINNISNGLKLAVDNKIKSERMKGELITNVSHDLKTPLTSIINYIHLLKDERSSEEEKVEYIKILDRKSQRLKALIEDLFEVSKAASGSMELNLEKVEIIAILRQTIGELKERIDESNITIRTNFPENKVYCKLDGNKTWRVFENLIVNISKYSLQGSRAFVEVVEKVDKVEITMKNISAEELNFNANEIVERFKRGDQSRHTEGSGLGLAISKSIVELQGGNFDIVIDGDLFKVVIVFDKINNI